MWKKIAYIYYVNTHFAVGLFTNFINITSDKMCKLHLSRANDNRCLFIRSILEYIYYLCFLCNSVQYQQLILHATWPVIHLFLSQIKTKHSVDWDAIYRRCVIIMVLKVLLIAFSVQGSFIHVWICLDKFYVPKS